MKFKAWKQGVVLFPLCSILTTLNFPYLWCLQKYKCTKYRKKKSLSMSIPWLKPLLCSPVVAGPVSDFLIHCRYFSRIKNQESLTVFHVYTHRGRRLNQLKETSFNYYILNQNCFEIVWLMAVYSWSLWATKLSCFFLLFMIVLVFQLFAKSQKAVFFSSSLFFQSLMNLDTQSSNWQTNIVWPVKICVIIEIKQGRFQQVKKLFLNFNIIILNSMTKKN